MQKNNSSQRDPRVDVLRGFALLTIFVDHVPGTILGLLTLRNFGFADAAEPFVVLAGYSAMAAYGKRFERDGISAGLRRITGRCVRLYAYQVGLLLVTLGIVNLWSAHHELHVTDLASVVSNGRSVLTQGLMLRALPSGLDILPLYIVLLALFPAIYAGLKFSRTLTLIASSSLWLAANCLPNLHFTNAIDGRGWFFNPFAWQFLFVIGAAAVTTTEDGSLPRLPRLDGICWAYLVFGVLAAAPWSTWGLFELRPIAVAWSDKTNLSLFRLFDILALTYLILSAPRLRDLARSRWLGPLEVCGRHSLEIFSLGTLLSLGGRLLLGTFGTTWVLQIAVDVIGLGCLLATASVLEMTWKSVPARPHGTRDAAVAR